MIILNRPAHRTAAIMILGALATVCGCGSPVTAGTSPAATQGTATTVASSSPGPPRSYLTAVSCVNSTFCVAVGADSGTGRSLAERWNGRRWRIMDAGAVTSRLSSVSCPSTTFCMAVGNASAQLWDGTRWWAVKTPQGAGSRVQAVSCAARRFCLAVGSDAAQVWNGVSWRVVSLPRPGIGLQAVSCPAVSYCLAVGSEQNHAGTRSLSRALHWTGRNWRATHPPSPGRFANLSGISCRTRATCVAIGWRGHCHQLPQPLGQHCFFSLRWDGRTWTPLPSPARTPLVANVACGSATACLAVGDCNLTANCRGIMALVLHGRAWHQPPALAPGEHGSSLEGVSCWRRSGCIATGGAVNSAGGLLPLAQSWNGLRWRVLPTAAPVR
ncbi:MAG TPA: hypothetical protein VF843_05725 [Streptosporangiaceae bacterium]